MNGSQTVLITNFGVHDEGKWAEATADHIVHIPANASAELRRDAALLEYAIAKALVLHHSQNQSDEREGLRATGSAHITTRTVCDKDSIRTALALEAVIAVTKGTRFEEQFSRPEVQSLVREIIAKHFESAAAVEHSIYSDDTPEGKAHREAHSIPHPAPDDPGLLAFRASRVGG